MKICCAPLCWQGHLEAPSCLADRCGHFQRHICVQQMLQRRGNEIAQFKGYAESSAVTVVLGRQENCRSV